MANLSSWKNWPKRLSLKRAFSKTNAKLAKRRKIGVVDATTSSSSELIDSPKTTFLDNELHVDISTESLDASELKLDKHIHLNGNAIKENVINLNNIETGKTNGGFNIDVSKLNASPVTVQHNGFIAEPPQESKKTKKKFFVNAISQSIFGKQQSRDASTHSTKEESSVKLRYNLSRRNSSEQYTHLGLLTPAFILHPTIHNEHILIKKLSNKLGDDLQLNLAAAHINDAINGRGKFGEARAIFKPSYIQKCFRVISSSWWLGLLYLTIITHCLMMFWEQPVTGIRVAIGQSWGSWPIHPVILVINAGCLTIYVVDIVLNSIFFTWKNFWFAKEALWFRVEFVFTCLFIIDYAILLAENFTSLRLICPFRCLRASMLLCKSKNVSHIFNVLLSIISKLGKVLFIIAIFIITFASVGLHIFMDYYHNLVQPCSADNPASGNCTNIYNGAFDNVAHAALHMFVLMSTENYPEFIIPAFKISWSNFFFFGLFLYAGVFFLTAILLAIIVESYWDYSKRHVKQERRQQREELVKAWNLMDPLGDGQLAADDKSLLKLFNILKPKNTDEENLELIRYISMYDDGVIDSYEWTTKLIETLSFEFEEEPDVNNASRPNNQQFVIYNTCQKICRRFIHANAVSVAVLVLILIHSILFCLMWTGISNIIQLAIQSTRTAIVAIFCVEILLRIIADGRDLVNVFDILDMLMVLFAVVADAVWYYLWFKIPRASSIHLGACVVVSGLAVLIRAVFNSQHARTAVRILRNIYPVMFDLILLVVTIIFNFAVIGFEMFQDKTLEASRAVGYEGSYTEYQCGVGFDTFGCSLLIVFQIVTTNDWQEIMLGAMLDAGWWACFYFLFCYLIVDMIVMNLFVAISIEAYKKLAIDNTTFMNNSAENRDTDSDNSAPKEDKSFTASAKHALGEIFAPSRKAKTSVSSNTLTGYSPSPYTVRRGTLGSLGRRTPTPSPRLDERRQSVMSISDTSHLSVSFENIPPPVEVTPPPPSSGDVKLRNMDRRQLELKKRQQRRKENRKSKQDETNPVEESRTATKLQIDDVVNLKRMVRVIKSFHARNLNEMNLKEGDMIRVSGKEQDSMLLGPKGWFPIANVVHNTDQPKPILGPVSEPTHSVSKESPGRPHHRVQFDVEVAEKKPRETPPRPRVSQTRMIRKKTDGGDWRRDIHGEMTVMNKDELQDLSRMIRGGLERRHTSQFRSRQSQLSLRLTEELLEEEEEEEKQVPQLTVSEVNPEPSVPESNSPTNNENNTLTLSVPKPHPPRRHVKPQKKGDGSMPDWMQKFVTERHIALDKDVKLDELNPPTPASEDQPASKMVDVVVHENKVNGKRKNGAHTTNKS